MPSRKAMNRPKKRNLVRWDDNLNEILLLTVQSVCNKNGIKIPWVEVAETMGHNATDGAIVQHLAKLRQRRVDAGKAVPPPLRRGGVGGKAAVSSSPRCVPATRKKRKSESVSDTERSTPVYVQYDDDSSEDYVEGKKGKGRIKSKPGVRDDWSTAHRERKQGFMSEDEEEGDYDSEVDTPGELLFRGAKFLDLPNDESVSSPVAFDPVAASPTAGQAQDSRIVVLRYRKLPSITTEGSSQPLSSSPVEPVAIYNEKADQSSCSGCVDAELTTAQDSLVSPSNGTGQHIPEYNTMSIIDPQSVIPAAGFENGQFDLFPATSQDNFSGYPYPDYGYGFQPSTLPDSGSFFQDLLESPDLFWNETQDQHDYVAKGDGDLFWP
ncbi:hypothetical protein P168DRAFT_322786 [Aspergillus campestris IBT 28561]|uniref:Myb-like domain-containing protein n=1 Tax=Aspergillus campestris (strain IBT 28561) TaxID=1392248 RepID=A0A2I1CQH3_ASPC2|nr:uncharacterized protein P168DRAFT_322786 [Aspergillus campestris IBT 28561]PKX99872.1 hypothetical protein P168DRAFT_322786 [Aspergillus campestris IBT 28561]